MYSAFLNPDPVTCSGGGRGGGHLTNIWAMRPRSIGVAGGGSLISPGFAETLLVSGHWARVGDPATPATLPTQLWAQKLPTRAPPTPSSPRLPSHQHKERHRRQVDATRRQVACRCPMIMLVQLGSPCRSRRRSKHQRTGGKTQRLPATAGTGRPSPPAPLATSRHAGSGCRRRASPPVFSARVFAGIPGKQLRPSEESPSQRRTAAAPLPSARTPTGPKNRARKGGTPPSRPSPAPGTMAHSRREAAGTVRHCPQ